MSLYGAIQQSANSLRVAELGLQVTGNNIANANTPGYIRQELVQSTAIGVRQGDIILGYGVRAVGVIQKVDEFVLDRLRTTQSELSYNDQLQAANARIESAIGELADNDISSAMSRFGNAFHDLSNQPGNLSFRHLVLQRGTELAESLTRLSSRAGDIQEETVSDIHSISSDINRLTKSIASLNRRIVEVEGGKTSNSDAVGLRDERIRVLDELSQYINIDAPEQESGAVTILVGGDYLVADGLQRDVVAELVEGDSFGSIEIRIADTDAPLKVRGGKLKGFYDTRDNIAGAFIEKIDGLARDIIQQVNRIHSEGQGSEGFTSVSSDYTLSNPNGPLEEAGLPFDFDNGTFILQIHDAQTGLTVTHDIYVRQQGFDSDTTAADLVEQLDDVSGISASISNDGRLQIQSDSEAIRFSFASDTSGVLAALGINSFFSGDSASSIQVRTDLVENPELLAASLNGVGNGAANAIRLAEAFEKPSAALGNQSLRDIYETTVIETTQQVNSQKGITEGLRNFYNTLEAQHFAVSGVSLDEEAVKMLLYQKTFQATARLISTVNDLFDTLVNVI